MDAVKTGCFIRERRKKLGYSQLKLAEMLYVEPQTISKWERGLGMLEVDGQPKPVGRAMAQMQKVLGNLPALPPRQIDAVCVLPDGERQLKGTSAFVLAQEAGFNITFTYSGLAVPESELYIVPSFEGWSVMYKRTLDYILGRVENHGAKCLFTYGGGDFIEIDKIFGVTSHGIRKSKKMHTVQFGFGKVEYFAQKEIYLESVGAEVLAQNEEGNAVFTRNSYGKGQIYFLGFPVEKLACDATDGLSPEITQPYYQIYRLFAEEQIASYVVQTDNPYIGITQHCTEDGSFYVTVINYSDKDRKPQLRVRDGWEIKTLYGDPDCIPACDGVILLAQKK